MCRLVGLVCGVFRVKRNDGSGLELQLCLFSQA